MYKIDRRERGGAGGGSKNRILGNYQSAFNDYQLLTKPLNQTISIFKELFWGKLSCQ